MTKERIEKMTGGPIKDVVPVSGIVKLDGAAQAGIVIALHAASARDGADPVAEVRTDSDGKFCWSTYKTCDGVVPGEYKLTFRNMPKVSKSGEGKDLFKGRYADPKKSDSKLIVVKGTPQKDVVYELKSN